MIPQIIKSNRTIHFKQSLRLLVTCMVLLILSVTVSAKKQNSMPTDSVSVAQALEENCNPDHHGSLFPQNSFSLALSHFTWGADLGSSIDMTGNDMSTFDVDVNLGYKNDLIRIIGIGAGVHRAFGTRNNFIPVYFLLRTSFRKSPSLLFMHLRAGYSFNTINDGPTRGDVSASLGLGVNLAISKSFKSHIILAYCFRHFNNRHRADLDINTGNISLAQLSFGVNF